eukprot:11742789-Alexandrium_andersonii.AAC.1
MHPVQQKRFPGAPCNALSTLAVAFARRGKQRQSIRHTPAAEGPMRAPRAGPPSASSRPWTPPPSGR